ncbi:MAG TPA: right-handed parallel beta-helix repeat-containing protein [Pyrinomonadaceae bacterium]|nr:right-handed parallel beta-helix repeat-containing protein [Pyrinomonadaceae bacterium]
MNKITVTFSALVMFFCSLVFTSTAEAQVFRTFVSTLGNDSNPCDQPFRPCRNIQAGIDKVASKGEVVVISSGSYQPFTANKSVTVLAPPGIHAGIDVFSAQGVIVSAGAANTGSPDIVVLRGLTVNGLGASFQPAGIQYVSGTALSIENCVIQGFSGNGIRIGGNGEQLFVKDTTVRNTGLNGIFVGATVTGIAVAVIERSRLENCGGGLTAVESGRVTMRDTVVLGNRGHGIFALGNSAGALVEINVENCLVSGQTTASGIVAGTLGSGGTVVVRVSNTTVTNNGSGIEAGGAGIVLSRGNNTVEGNGVDGTFTGAFAAK